MQRTTLQQPTQTITGLGLFSGTESNLTMLPAQAGDGIVFDLNTSRYPAHIVALSIRPVHPVFATMKPRCTSVGDDERSIATIEHVMSALAGLGITDAVVQVRTYHAHSEVPIVDGSAKPFVDAILSAGIESLDAEIQPHVVRERIEVRDGDASIIIEPSDHPVYTYNIDYPGTPIGSASATWEGDRDEYIHRVAPARTFSLEREANQMHAAGLFTHVTTREMLVVGDDGPINNTLRMDNEYALHKLLDLIGDLALVGRPLIAKVTADRSGHALAHQAARAILDAP